MNASWSPGKPVLLDTARFIVRSMTPEDINERYLAWLGDPEITATLNVAPRNMTRAQMVEYVRKFDNKASFHFGVFTREGNRLIGIYSVYCDFKDRLAQTNVVIGEKEFWGKKVVIETRAAIIDFLFDRMNMEKIWGRPIARNMPAIFNYKAQGFRCEGVLHKHLRDPSGKRIDQIMFGLLRDEWRGRRRGGGQ